VVVLLMFVLLGVRGWLGGPPERPGRVVSRE